MSFAPVIPFSGILGWEFLKRSEATQSATLMRQAALVRDEAYFRERIGGIDTAEDLVSDRRLLRISLEAFGLQEDLNARAFIRKVLEEGTLKTEALANRLTDTRYKELSAAFGFGNFSVPSTKISTFADGIMARWKEARFEAAVGSVNNDMRLALNARRELSDLAGETISDRAKWFRVLGNPPLWEVMRQALGLPKSLGSLDLDRQVSVLETRARAVFGSEKVSQFAEPAKVEQAIRRFLAVSSAQMAAVENPALTLLQSARLSMRL
ncbi:flagellar protein [Tabrizicola sp. TH137]|uniref:DUF1217 domain-containing protein n=1 Tax=Tabrizicola sp. TH137 TaxID=2067452 RepID=UPI000C7DF664|nr:DUF1217 domain-containing protein [Tabrizicola sp. TH137]PLL14627.1 flagellar protein [Tabrizicola sp. TH137]